MQLAEGHTAWVKYYRSPTDGFVINYWGATTPAGEREALTRQDQTAKNYAAQYSGVLRDNWSVEAAFADYSSQLFVGTFESSGRLGNAPIFNEADNKYYNGATFDGYTDRPRRQFNAASNWFLTPGGRSHDVKVGLDFQDMESRAEFKYPNAQYLRGRDLQPGDWHADVPVERDDFQTGPSISKGNITALFARDKMQLTNRLLRRSGPAVGAADGRRATSASRRSTRTCSPRVSRASFDLSGDGKTLITGSYGRYYASIIQGFSDSFANVPQQENYDVYLVERQPVRLFAQRARRRRRLHPEHRPRSRITWTSSRSASSVSSASNMGAGVRYIAPQLGRPHRRHPHLPRRRLDRPPGRQLRRRRARATTACS